MATWLNRPGTIRPLNRPGELTATMSSGCKVDTISCWAAVPASRPLRRTTVPMARPMAGAAGSASDTSHGGYFSAETQHWRSSPSSITCLCGVPAG